MPAPLGLLPALLLAQSAAAAEQPAPLRERLRAEGGVDVYAGYDFNRPADRSVFPPGTGSTAKRHGEVALNLASLGLRLAPEPVGFHVLLGVGTSMEVVHAGEPTGTAVGPEVWRFLQQASASFAVGALTLEAGVYPSHIGLESFQSQRNWSYTRSYLGEYSPYYQTGLKATYAFDARWSAQLHLLNGWQLIGDNNGGKSVGTQVAYAGERLGVSLNTLLGPELPGDDTHLRLLGDVVATYEVSERLQLALTADAALQQRPQADAAHWYGAAANARVQLSGKLAVAARAELFDDPDGAISGTPQTLREGTVTLQLTPTEHLLLKLEARHDRSSASVFGGSETDAAGAPVPLRTQTLLVASATVSFD